MKLAALVLATMAAPAAAGDGGTEHWFASAGGTVAAAVHDAGTGGVAGGELSIVHVTTREAWPRRDDPSCNHCASALEPVDVPDVRGWIGGYVDIVYDSQPHRARLTLGPELGVAHFGFDGGLAIQPSGGRVGAALRAVATVGVVAAYVRGEHYFDGAADATLLEVGALIKLPHAL